MKSFFAFFCLAAIFVASAYTANIDIVKSQIQLLKRSFSKLGSQEGAILGLADLYYHVNHLSGSTVEELTDCFNAIDDASKWIAKSNTAIFGQVLYNLYNQTSPHYRNIIDRWHAEFSQRLILDESYEEIEGFLRHHIKLLIDEPLISPSILISALYNGGGLCHVFDIPFMSGAIIDNDAKFGKAVFLLREFDLRNLFIELRENDKLVLSIQKLGIACEKLRVTNKLNPERQKAFLSAVLDKNLDTPIARLGGYVGDICVKLKNIGIRTLSRQHKLPVAIRVFAYECIDDLAKRWTRAFNAQNIQMYRASLITRWFERLDQYIELTTDKAFTCIDDFKYLQRMVDEVPAQDALLAYEQGQGFCNIILDDEEIGPIGTYFEFIENLCKNELDYSLENIGVNLENLTKLKNLRIVCLRRRDLKSRKRSHQQIEF